MLRLRLIDISLSSQQKAETHVLRAEEDALGEEEEEKGDVPLLSSQHECPLVQQKVTEYPATVQTASHDDCFQISGSFFYKLI